MATQAEVDELWNEWFDGQDVLTDCIEKAINKLAQGKDDNFKAALHSAVIEYSAEQLRMYIVPIRA